MRRVFWMAVGAGAGVYLARRLQQAAREMRPDAVAARGFERARVFWTDLRTYAAEREVELRDALGLADGDDRP